MKRISSYGPRHTSWHQEGFFQFCVTHFLCHICLCSLFFNTCFELLFPPLSWSSFSGSPICLFSIFHSPFSTCLFLLPCNGYLSSSFASVFLIDSVPSFSPLFSHTNPQEKVQVCSLGLKEKGFNTYLCVCVCVWVAECMLACTPLLLVWNWEILVWIYKRIQWRCVEFSFLSLQKKESAPRLRQGEFVFLFRVVHPLCTKHTLTNIQPVGGGLWMMYGALL